MKKFIKNNHGSAIGFIIGMLVIGLVVAGVVGSLAYQLIYAGEDVHVTGGKYNSAFGHNHTADAAGDKTAPGIPGGPAMLMILGLLFIVVPVIIFARAAK